jgi:hypothetical protein
MHTCIKKCILEILFSIVERCVTVDDENQPDTVRDKARALGTVKQATPKTRNRAPHKLSPGKKRKAPSSQSKQGTVLK